MHHSIAVALRRIALNKKKKAEGATSHQGESASESGSGGISASAANNEDYMHAGLGTASEGEDKEGSSDEERRYLFEEKAWKHKWGQRHTNLNAKYGYGATKEERLARKRLEEARYFYKF